MATKAKIKHLAGKAVDEKFEKGTKTIDSYFEDESHPCSQIDIKKSTNIISTKDTGDVDDSYDLDF